MNDRKALRYALAKKLRLFLPSGKSPEDYGLHVGLGDHKGEVFYNHDLRSLSGVLEGGDLVLWPKHWATVPERPTVSGPSLNGRQLCPTYGSDFKRLFEEAQLIEARGVPKEATSP